MLQTVSGKIWFFKDPGEGPGKEAGEDAGEDASLTGEFQEFQVETRALNDLICGSLWLDSWTDLEVEFDTIGKGVYRAGRFTINNAPYYCLISNTPYYSWLVIGY